MLQSLGLVVYPSEHAVSFVGMLWWIHYQNETQRNVAPIHPQSQKPPREPPPPPPLMQPSHLLSLVSRMRSKHRPYNESNGAEVAMAHVDLRLVVAAKFPTLVKRET
jgi:hypothetical protein